MQLKKDMNAESGEAKKLQQHLTLLREQYVRVQERCAMLDQRLSLVSSTVDDDQDSFLGRLLKFVASLYDKKDYSDVVVKLCNGKIHAHRFVLAARGESWGVASLAEIDTLDWSDFEEGVGASLLSWIYTDHIDLTDHHLTLKLIRAAARFQLKDLVKRCEESLIGWINVRNCVQLYTTAEEVGAEILKSHCSTLISTHWNDFTPEDFSHMSGPLLYSMFKSKTKFLLHASVRLQREDVLFLYLIEFDSLLPSILDKTDDTGRLPLDLALESKHLAMANTLLKHGASVDAVDDQGIALLQCAVIRGDVHSARFLLENNVNVNAVESSLNRTALHLIAVTDYQDNETLKSMADVAQLMLEKGADPNMQDINQKTVLHLAVENLKLLLFETLLKNPKLKLNPKDDQNLPPLWYALLSPEKDYSDRSFALLLIKNEAPLDEKLKNGNTLLHLVSEVGLEEAGIFLTKLNASPSLCNFKGETPMHLSCTNTLPSLTSALLKAGADPNLQTYPPSPSNSVNFLSDDNNSHNPFGDEYGVEDGSEFQTKEVFGETPLHRAVRNKNFADADAILDHKGRLDKTHDPSLIKPSFDLQDSEGLTALGVAVLGSHLTAAKKLLAVGAQVDGIDGEGRSLLHRALMSPTQDTDKIAEFLVVNGADTNLRTLQGYSPLQLCIQNRLSDVIGCLCERGADMGAMSPDSPDPPLWSALETDQKDIAEIMVRYKVDVDGWSPGPEGCLQTLLHRAIDENREDIACFLVQSGCEVNALRQEGPAGRRADLAREHQTPLHMCCSWGLVDTAKALIQNGAKINAKDCEGNTAIHLALENCHPDLIETLLGVSSLDLSARNKAGRTPFSVAMAIKNNKAAQSILHKYPSAAEQYDAKGLTYLHSAIHKDDLEAVLFLLSIHVSLSSRTKDERQFTPLHLATVQGNEMVLRNLILAGASINELSPQKQTCLHLCALHDRPALATILLQNSINVDTMDNDLNNALHVAIKEGHLSMVRVLMQESCVNAGAINLRGQNPLHVLGAYPKDNAAAIAQLFLESLPEYPLDNCDVDGNTPLLLAYMRGSGLLCRVLVRSGACLGTPNKQGIHLFNYEVATKALLRRLLDAVAVEPPWSEGDFCLECEAKFGLATRKHHCRHCGRLLCSKCSGKDVPILKYDIKKPVRVCQMCFEVLTLGPASPN